MGVWRAVPIRIRLTLWYSGVLAATLALFGLVLYLMAAQNFLRWAETTVQDRADKVAMSMEIRTIGGHEVVLLPPMDPFAEPDVFVQAVDAFGTVQARSNNLGSRSLPVTTGTRAAVRQGRGTLEYVEVAGQRLLLYNRPMFPGDPGSGVIQIGLSVSRIAVFLERLHWMLLLIGAGGLLLAGTLGVFLARQALRPVDRLGRDAEAIGLSQDLSRRVADPGTNDEVGRLAKAFNEMLARLEEAHEKLEATLAAQRRFVADASHELRTPLTAIRTNAEVLRDAGACIPPEEQAQALNDIVSESERLTRLVNGLLTLARADAGLHLERTVLDPGPIVEEVYRQARLLGREQIVTLGAVETAPVLGNADAIKQLLLILADNAVKYTPPGGKVDLSARREGEWVLLQVSDTGPGIAPEDLPHLFDRFYRADRARHTGGAGLGLAIARWIAGEHGGLITVDSEPGRGSTFTVRLPVAVQSQAAVSRQLPAEGASGRML